MSQILFKVAMAMLHMKQTRILWGQFWRKKIVLLWEERSRLAPLFFGLVDVMSGTLIVLLASLGHKQNGKQKQNIKMLKQKNRKNQSP